MPSPSFLPRAFEYSRHCYSGVCRVVECRDGSLVDRVCDDADHEQSPTERRFTPSEAAWRRFWKEVDQIGLWDWMEDFSVPILDGVTWQLHIEHDRQIRSGGSNGYPRAGVCGEDLQGSDLEKFENALDRLIGVSRAVE